MTPSKRMRRKWSLKGKAQTQNSNRIKPQHANKSRLHSDKMVPGDMWNCVICKIVNWQNNRNISGILAEEGNSVTFFESHKSTDCVKLLKSVKSDNLNKLVFAHLSINSIRNKFEFFCRARDVLMISETKIYDSFPTGNLWLMVAAHRAE